MKWLYKKLKTTALAERERVFMGSDGFIYFPNENVSGDEIKSLLKNNHYKGKNVTRKFIEHFHAPVDCHVENMEDNELYRELVKIIYPVLNVNNEGIDNILEEVFAQRGYLFFNDKSSGLSIVRNEIIPVVVDFYHTMIFGKP